VIPMPPLRPPTLVLLALVACDAAPTRATASTQPTQDFTDTVTGVRYTIRLPASYARDTSIPTDKAHAYRDQSERLGPGITIAVPATWPADLDDLRFRTVTPSDAEQWRFEARADGFTGTRIQPDRLKTTLFVLRQQGPHKLSCSGQAGFTHDPLPDIEATTRQLMTACDSLQILP
jgi:hypothetical protein